MMRSLRTVACVVALCSALAAHAQGWPQRPVRVIVPFPPAGGLDVTARLIGDKLARALGQQVLVDNRSGAGGAIGTAEAARAAPDGHTLLFTADTGVMLQVTQGNLPWDILRDFAPVTQVTTQPLVVAVHSAVPVNHIRDLIALVKANPGRYSYAHSGAGTTQHMAGELIKQIAGLDMAHVPYKGGGPATQDLAAGQVPIGLLGPTPLLPHAKAGRVKLLAFTSRERFALLPQVPTLQEAGFAGFDVTQWFGIFAPAGTSHEVIKRLHAEVRNVLSMQDVSERLAQLVLAPVGSPPDEFDAAIRLDMQRWTKLVAELNLKSQ
jgi:tripartite-type tricarboxylate transporter receptor subunit TctC